MSRIVIKTIKGRRYRYLQRSYRDGGRVRTESLYLGPVDGGRRKGGIFQRIGELIAANRAEPGTRLINQLLDEWEKQAPVRAAAEKRTEEAFYSRMHALYGMTKASANPMPVEKSTPAIDAAAAAARSPAEATATESPSAEEGAGAADAAPSE